jgi:hypothetical protein
MLCGTGLISVFTITLIALPVCFYTQGARGAGYGQACGGFVGVPCDPGLHCQYTLEQANVADAMGVCQPPATAPAQPPATAPIMICLETILPVCGQSGRTYRNDCVRQLLGDQKRSDGVCPPN